MLFLQIKTVQFQFDYKTRRTFLDVWKLGEPPTRLSPQPTGLQCWLQVCGGDTPSSRLILVCLSRPAKPGSQLLCRSLETTVFGCLQSEYVRSCQQVSNGIQHMVRGSLETCTESTTMKIPKPGNVKTLQQANKPITLLLNDCKIFMSVWAKQITKVIGITLQCGLTAQFSQLICF